MASEGNLTRLARFIRQLWPWRWARSVLALSRGVRVHPQAMLGAGKGILLGRGTTVGARTRVILGQSARFVTGEGVWLSSDIEIQTDTEVSIGAGTTVQRRCTINGTTRIGRGCILAPNVFISSGTHPFRAFPHLPIREQERRLAESGLPDAPISIQDDCWLAVNVVICPGVTVGKGSVVGANSVVVKSVAPYSVVAGAPARLIGQRLQWRPADAIDLDDERDLIHVLSGTAVLEAEGRAVATSPQEPLRVMLSAQASRVRIYYETSAGARIEAGGAVHAVAAGDGSVEISLIGLAIENGVKVLDVRLLPPFGGGSFRVHRIIRLDDA